LEYLDSINLFDCGMRILETLKEGILSAAASVVDGVTGVFKRIRALLPFSDAKAGPLSDLTLSGARLMTTLAEGVQKGASELVQSVDDALGGIAPALAPVPVRDDGQGRAWGRGDTHYTIHIGSVSLPDVKDGGAFIQALEDYVHEYGGGLASS
jgi:hypothetical protein